jgi:hypothetical protein
MSTNKDVFFSSLNHDYNTVKRIEKIKSAADNLMPVAEFGSRQLPIRNGSFVVSEKERDREATLTRLPVGVGNALLLDEGSCVDKRLNEEVVDVVVVVD